MKNEQFGFWPGWAIALGMVSFLVCDECPGQERAQAERWGFDEADRSWIPSGKGIRLVSEPGKESNRVCEILATDPHHTRVSLPGGGKNRDFHLSLRYRVVETEGEPPRIYLYGRSNGGGFRGISLSGDGAGTVFCYLGQNRSGGQIGSLPPAGANPGEWVHAALACSGDELLGKSWLEGMPEPGWQVAGSHPGQELGSVAFGVWTSPRTPSKARVLFDDVTFGPLAREDLGQAAAWLEVPPPLQFAEVPSRPGVFRVPGRVGLATTRTAIAFDERSGEVVNLVDRPSGREFISREGRRPLFDFVLTKPAEGRRVRFDSRAFRRVRIEPQDPHAAVMDFSDHPDAAFSAQVTARLVDGEQIAFGIRLRNASDWCVASVVFPRLPCDRALGGDGTDDRLLLPWSGGAVLDAPGSMRAAREVEYPGAAVAQFYALYDGAAGLYCGMRDGGGHCKQFRFEAGSRDVRMDLEHRFPELPRRDAELPYEVRVTTYRGDWRDAAEIYKSWAVAGGLWECPRLAERPDVPAFLKDGAAVLIVGFRGTSAEERFGARGEKLLEMLDAYRERTGVKRIVFVPYGWENRGTWAGIQYLPAHPSNEYWETVNQALRAADHRTAFLLSGYWWVVKRRQTSNGPAFDDTADFERRQDMCVASPDGSVLRTDNYDKVGIFGDWRGLSATLCHGSREASEALLEQFLGVARLGTPLASFDQEIGGAQHAPCYHTGHGHPPGYGSWMWEGFRDLCVKIREEGRADQPEIGLFLENESELAVPLMATYWSRQFGEVDVGLTGARGVGLFSYLYHEYVTAIGAACVQGQGAQGTRPDALLRCRVLANNLTRGLIPGPFQHDVALDPGKDPWKETVTAAFLSYCRPYSRFPEYLVLGRSRRPAAVECEEVETWYWRKKLDKEEAADPVKREESMKKLRLPAVTSGCFEAADGSLAHVVVNGTPEERKSTVALPADKEVVIYSATREELGRVPADRGERRVPLILEPFGVRVLIAK